MHMQLLTVAQDHLHLLPVKDPTPASGLNNPAPVAPPGMQGTFNDWIAWAKYLGMVAGVIGFIACGIMMMVGRRNRSHLAAEGAGGLVWTIAGISTVTLAVSVVTAMMS
ncbi:hypothetical protein [Actinacidiphila sp. bgisy144]|uniref:hypothetical protein n=1 Tax=Actinacidiphila sp. bgisy144 TaxID=3413791 RepID=UPI003EC0B09F